MFAALGHQKQKHNSAIINRLGWRWRCCMLYLCLSIWNCFLSVHDDIQSACLMWDVLPDWRTVMINRVFWIHQSGLQVLDGTRYMDNMGSLGTNPFVICWVQRIIICMRVGAPVPAVVHSYFLRRLLWGNSCMAKCERNAHWHAARLITALSLLHSIPLACGNVR